MDYLNRLTIIVPTANRYSFLRRLMSYYRMSGLSAHMLVLDSSRTLSEKEKLDSFFEGGIFSYFSYPSDTHPLDKIYDGLKKVLTPYVVLWGDDDLLVPAALTRGVDFLEKHSDYSIVHGKAALFNVVRARGKADVHWISPYPQASLTQEDVAGRLCRHLANYNTTFYSLHRTADLITNLEVCKPYGFSCGFEELSLSCLSVVQGKVGRMKGLFLFRQCHDQMDSWYNHNKKYDALDRVMEEDYRKNFFNFQECLAKYMAIRNILPEQSACDLVHDAYWRYMANVLNRKLIHRDRRDMARKLKIGIKADRENGLKPWIRMVKSVAALRHEVSLPSMSMPFSPHHKDFCLLRKAIRAIED